MSQVAANSINATGSTAQFVIGAGAFALPFMPRIYRLAKATATGSSGAVKSVTQRMSQSFRKKIFRQWRGK